MATLQTNTPCMTLHESDFSEINHYNVVRNLFFQYLCSRKMWKASFGATPHRGLPSVQVLRFLSALQRGYSQEKPSHTVCIILYYS